MSKQRKKLRCICKGKAERIHQGMDHQKHIESCPMVTQRKR